MSENNGNSFAAVTRKYRGDQGLTQEKFVELLTERFRGSLTRQAVSLWEKGETEPRLDDLFWIMLIYSDWRMQWAIDAIVARMPEAFARDQFGLTVKKNG